VPASRKLIPSEIKQKIYAYCAYQERSHQEVRNKLYEMGAYSSDVDELISGLITEGYLNEERFAKAFAGGKFRIKGWGRIKIRHELEAKGLTPRCIESGMKEIDDDDYVKSLESLLEKKLATFDEEVLFEQREKLARYAIQKGYEPELVWKTVKTLLK
jgi:regulatory protein